MQEARDEPQQKIVNVFEVLKKVATGTAFRNDSSEATCANHIRQMLDGALARQRWALMMVDATAKLPEPLLGGLRLHLGDYDQCLRARSQAFAGRYCLVAAMGQRVATCVPSTCSWRSLDVLLANHSAGVVRVPAHTCQSAEDPFAFHPAIVALGAVVLLAVLNALGWFLLTYEGVRRKLPARWQPSQETAKAMSPVTAWRKISGAPDPAKARAARPRPHAPGAAEAGGAGDSGEAHAVDEARDPSDWSRALPRLSAASGLRTVSMVWVVIGHRDALMAQLPVLDKRALPERMKQWAHVYVPAGLFAVDTFLFLAGCVLAFSFACTRRRHPRSLRQLCVWLPAFYLHRYIRLTPLMAFVMLLYAGGLLYLGEGPLWEQLSAFDVNSCRTNWWPNFLYIHNYYNNRNMCIGHSWYLAVDMQLFLIAPLLLFPLVDHWDTGRFNYGRWVFAFFLIMSIAIPFALVMLLDLTPTPNPLGDPQKNLAHAELVYIPAHARAAPWVVGMGVGACAARVVGGGQALGRWAERVLWACAVGLLVGLPLALTGALRAGDRPSRWGSALFVALSKPLWALGLGAVVVLCAAGRAPRLNALLSWEPLAVLSRLSFAVYLLHPTVQGVTGWSTRGTTVASDVTTIPLIVADVVLTFAFALPVSILIESPFIALERLLLRGRKTDGRGSPPPPAAHSAGGHAPAPIHDPESPAPAPEQRREGGAWLSRLNLFAWCRDRLPSFRTNRRRNGDARRSRSGSRSGPAQTGASGPYATLHSESCGELPSPSETLPVEQSLPSEMSEARVMPLSSEKSLAGDLPKPSELPSIMPSALFPTSSSIVEPDGVFGSAVSSSSDESKPHPFIKGGSSETLWRVPSGEKLPMEEKAARAHSPMGRSSSDESAKTPPATRRSLENVDEEEVTTDTV